MIVVSDQGLTPQCARDEAEASFGKAAGLPVVMSRLTNQ